MKKILIIRFSSFGDIVQGTYVLPFLKATYEDCQIHWITKTEFSYLLEKNPKIDHVISFDKKKGVLGLIKLALFLRSEQYDLVYDAHCNIRSKILKFFLTIFSNLKVITRKKERAKRFLLFKLGLNRFDWPYKGAQSYLKPLQDNLEIIGTYQKWDLEEESQKLLLGKFKHLRKGTYIALAPSAAWEMKRWPVIHWKTLIQKLLHHTPISIVLLGGPKDDFINELVLDDKRVINLAGKTSLFESCLIAVGAKSLVSADTGIMHVADLCGVSGVALIGPTAFGHPTNDNMRVMEVELSCRPCTKDGRGSCSQPTYQKCMVDISPDSVFRQIIHHS